MDEGDPGRSSLKNLREELTSALVSDALDEIGQFDHSPRRQFRPLTVDTFLVGRCKTTLWVDVAHEEPNPYELELRAVDEGKPDEVLIAAAGGSMRSGIWGELLSTAAIHAGCVGVIVDGAVRDLAKMRQMNFPVFALGTSVYDSKNRQRVVNVDIPVEIANVRFCPGDLVFADSDGVVVVPQEFEAEVIRRAWEKVRLENQFRQAVRSGMKATEAYDKFGIL